jgi:hypothetical protein
MDMIAQSLKREGRRTWRPERVVWIAGGGVDVVGGMIGVVLATEWKEAFPQSVLLQIYAGLSL